MIGVIDFDASTYATIQAAINALGANGGKILLSGSTYTIGTAGNTTAGLKYPASTDDTNYSLVIEGIGQGITELSYVGSGWAIDSAATTATETYHFEIRDLMVHGNTAALGGVYFRNMARGRLRGVQITNFEGSGAWAVVIDGTSQTYGANENVIDYCDIWNNSNGVKFTGGPDVGSGRANGNKIVNSRVAVSQANGIAVLCDSGDTNFTFGTSIHGSAASTIGWKSNDYRDMIIGSRIEFSAGQPGTTGVVVTSGATDTVAGPVSIANMATRYDDQGVNTYIQHVGFSLGMRLVPVAVFAAKDIPANTTTVLPIAGSATSAEWQNIGVLNAGSIGAVTWRWNAAISAGTFTVQVFKNGSLLCDTGSQTAQTGQSKFIPGVNTFAQTANLGVRVLTSSGFSPTTDDLNVTLWLYQ